MVAYVRTPSGKYVPLTADENGKLPISLQGATVEIGEVALLDGAGNAISSTVNGAKRLLDVNDPIALAKLVEILAKLSSDPATQTTLAAVLAKLSADPATQTTLAAVLTKLSSDPSTATLQGTGNTSLAAIAKRYSQPSTASISVAAAGDATIIAAPAAGHQIVVYSLFMTCLVNNIVLLKAGSTEIARAYVYGFSKDYISGLPLGEAHALVITPTTADPIYGGVVYVVEAL